MDLLKLQWNLKNIIAIIHLAICIKLAMGDKKYFKNDSLKSTDFSSSKPSPVFLEESDEQPVYMQSLKKGTLIINYTRAQNITVQ